MKGLELCREYWETVGKPELLKVCPELLSHCAVGLVGEGSECFGFDDEISRDHDWGPGFCLWLTDEDMALYGDALRDAYATLPQEFHGFRRLRESAMSAGRIGVLPVGDFYRRYIGVPRAPETLREWRIAPEDGLSVVTNGAVFSDAVGVFSEIRGKLLEFYPEDYRRKKLAACCAEAAQSGQYNYSRCLRRGETVAAHIALSRYISAVQSILFLLNRRYKPYYKWSQRALRELPLLGHGIAPLLEKLAVGTAEDNVRAVEQVAAQIIDALRAAGLSDADSDFLMPHAQSVQEHIADENLRRLHLMAQ